MEITKLYKGISGIYKITNLVNNKCYLGSAKCLYSRLHNHFSKLKLRKHSSNHLQSSANKYGIDNFQYEIMMLCPVEKLILLEQIFIDVYQPEYNKRIIAGSNLGKKHSKETRDKISKNRKGKYSPHVEHRNAISLAHKGKRRPEGMMERLREIHLGSKRSEETCRKMSESKKELFRLGILKSNLPRLKDK